MTPTKHFDYFRFYDMLLIIYCDEQDEIIGYFTIRNGNEFGQVSILPSHRGSEVVHLLIWEAAEIVYQLGFPYIFGLCYERMKKYYDRFIAKYDLGDVMKMTESPKERADGQWKVVYTFDETYPDRRDSFRRQYSQNV